MRFSQLIVSIILLIIVIVFPSLHCNAMPAGGSSDEIPYPRIPSIIPLMVNSRWYFSHTAYDSLGNLTASDQSLGLHIDRVFGMDNNQTLTLITEKNWNLKFPVYVYEYEWEELNEGLLISYLDKQVDTFGIYRCGEYVGEDRIVYKKPILWLKYPASPGDTWFVFSPDSTDTTRSYFTLIDTSAQLGIPSQSTNSTPLEFISCHVYQETKGDVASYYYFNYKYGSVSFLRYINGVLRRTYIIEKYHSN